MTGTRPMVLGYIREHVLMTPAEVARVRGELETFARTEGYALGTVFVERLDRSPAAFHALVAALGRVDRPAVVIPAVRHLAAVDGVRNLKQHLEQRTGARVFVVRSS